MKIQSRLQYFFLTLACFIAGTGLVYILDTLLRPEEPSRYNTYLQVIIIAGTLLFLTFTPKGLAPFSNKARFYGSATASLVSGVVFYLCTGNNLTGAVAMALASMAILSTGILVLRSKSK
ncbi:MAG: hypothetical protein LUE26_05825 [Alistipes sp.]|nr:hypothetical protein [Alistipes sp.]